MTRPWREPTPTLDGLNDAVGNTLVAAALSRRGITTADEAKAFLDPDAYTPADPFDLPDMKLAVERIERAIDEREPICVWGDFDVDGQTATALLVQALTTMGADARFYIPERQSEGHGIHLASLQKQIDAGAKVILTCDTGIAAHEAVEYANSRGVDVIVTDHHHLPDTLPKALANVNPQRLAPDHPLYTLPGVGVAYQLARALETGVNSPSPMERGSRPSVGGGEVLLDLVALGIVADVAVQVKDTRYLLQRGLRQLREALRPGLAALADIAGLDPRLINEQHIGFVIAPRLNAAGRLADASLGVELLLAPEPDSARTIALKLESLNAQRKLLCDQIEASAEAMIERDPSLKEADVLVLSHPDWHTGVVGIVANRLVEKYNVPVILLAAPDDEDARGSARSVDGVDITEALAANAHLLISYGGHTMAAGMRLVGRNISYLRRALSKTVRATRGEVAPGELMIDAEATIPDVTLDLVDQIERLAPFGAGNPPVILSLKNLTLNSHTIMGRDKAHRRLIVEDDTGNSLNAVWWDGASQPLPEGRFDLACVVRASDYKGTRRVEVEYIDSRPVAEAVSAAYQIEIIDHRADPDPVVALKALGDIQVWSEGDSTVTGKNRLDLQKSDSVAIWTTPPDREILKQVAATSNRIHVFAVNPPTMETQVFLQRLLGLAKYALQHKSGQTDWETLAAAMATTERAIVCGMDALDAAGAIKWTNDSIWVVRLEAGTGQRQPDAAAKRAKLEAVLNEIAAFRNFFKRADLQKLIGD